MVHRSDEHGKGTMGFPVNPAIERTGPTSRARAVYGRRILTRLTAARLGTCVALIMCGLTHPACSNTEATSAHNEVLVLRSRVTAGMTPAEMEAAFKDLKLRHVRFDWSTDKAVRFQQIVPEYGVQGWVLWVSLRQGRAAAVRIRTVDSELERPTGAPEDLIWAEEDDGTPFKKPFLRERS